MKLSALAAILIFVPFSFLTAQDTLPSYQYKPVDIESSPYVRGKHLPEIQGTVINAGKKNEVVVMEKTSADLSVNSTRQVFGRVPGIMVWENDGSGIQVGIATRGLSPNRSWEFNVRQNGYDISSDVFGYPEAYYSPPMEALSSIELVRGAGGLQYGPQFGGLLNYVIKRGPTDRKVSVESSQTVGSFGLFNSYNAIGGQVGKLRYYGFFHNRSAEGWRENSRYFTRTGYLNAEYMFNEKWSAGLEFTSSYFESQQPGGLTDEQFNADPRQSLRARNWMSTPWNVLNLNVNYRASENTRLSLKVFALDAHRSSVGFTSAITTPDVIIDSLDVFANRQVDRDFYTNIGTELRFLQRYQLAGRMHELSGGVRYFSGSTERLQRGKGTAGSDFDLNLVDPVYGRSYDFMTRNAAVFLEQVFHLSDKLIVIPGVRAEYISNSMEGYLVPVTGELEPVTRTRQFLLYALAAEYHLGEGEFYANYSRSFRPVTFSELTPSATTDVIDQDLEDASGYNVDLGYRSQIIEGLNVDAGLYYLVYDNRIGTIVVDGVNLRTNIGTSETYGAELSVDASLMTMLGKKQSPFKADLFFSGSWLNAEYTRWDDPVAAEDPGKDRVGNKVEYAPESIYRGGLQLGYKGLFVSLQYSSVAAVFSDASNTEEPVANGTAGIIPAYEVMDLNAGWKFLDRYTFRAGVNNLTDAQYFTRRAGGYPGPGIMPANGRTFYAGLSVTI